MNLTWDYFLASRKTKTEASMACKDAWVARSAVGVKIDQEVKAIFGFGAGFCKTAAETSSLYELLERLVFLPYAHDTESLNKPVSFVSNELTYKCANETVQQYLIGSFGPKGIFNANGCALSSNAQHAVSHAKRELIERHLCCEIWYKQTRPLLPYPAFKMEALRSSIHLGLYTTDITSEGEFALAALEDSEVGFFALGAAIRSNILDACTHAACEALMLLNDAIKERTVGSSTEQSRQQILSLRDKQTSRLRKMYFQSLITRSLITKRAYFAPVCKTIIFEPLPNIYAARAFSLEALDPREFYIQNNIPSLPLF